MITLRRDEARRHERRRNQEAWHTFDFEHGTAELSAGLGSLESLDEERLPPGASASARQPHEAEIITYVREGTLAQQDSMGGSNILRAGEFQHRIAGRGVRHSMANASRTDWAQVFQIRLEPSVSGLEPACAQKRFSAAERRGVLCVVASPDGRRGSLRTHQDVLMCSTLLDPGQHVVHELSSGASAWLHVVHGEVSVGDLVLGSGDGAGFVDERAVSLTARVGTEVLLLDLGQASSNAQTRESG